MSTVIIAILVVLVLLVGAYYYWYTTQNTKWTAYADAGNAGTFVVLRKVKGNVECAATDGKNCTRFGAQAPANAAAAAYNAANSVGLKPLACGDAHKAAYGVTGYDSGPKHWCNTQF
ncbi:hypothetical protein F-M6_0352 [Faustovirus]|nr:hypothetical protein F-LCD7_0347 [Faustovirus]QJX72115.1 hypothetical protein F-M6_0352 [Faustovirus]QJX73106.1 hypothetical protein F-VV57_0345 [Faustovirus]QJX73613.1 hypothetical protein F-VV63_0347 [Faustovirus]